MANLTNSAKLIQEMAKKANRTELPEVNNSTVNFTVNGNTGSTSMTTNQASNSTVNLTVDKTTVGLGNVDNTSDVNKPISTATQAALDLKADKSDLSSVYKYKGSVASYSNLPSTGLTAGDVYNVEDTGMNYAWTGSAWDQLGASVDLSNYLAKNNTTAFTPTGDYNPATKKYVDDNTKAVSGIGTTQPSSPSEGAIYYDTTNDILKTYDGSQWNEVGGGGHDYSWETKTITSGAVELGLRTIVEPTSNFTLNAPSIIEDGMEYVLRCVNGSTAYTLTLGTGFVNDFGTSLTLNANYSDQFTFVAYDGTLELQPDYATNSELSGKQDTLVSGTNIKTVNNQSILGSGNITIESGGIQNDTTGTTTTVAKIRAGTEAEFNALTTKDGHTIYHLY